MLLIGYIPYLKLNGEKDNSMEGQHQSSFELVFTNMSAVPNDVVNKLQFRDCSVNNDFPKYKIKWLCALLLSRSRRHLGTDRLLHPKGGRWFWRGGYNFKTSPFWGG